MYPLSRLEYRLLDCIRKHSNISATDIAMSVSLPRDLTVTKLEPIERALYVNMSLSGKSEYSYEISSLGLQVLSEYEEKQKTILKEKIEGIFWKSIPVIVSLLSCYSAQKN